LKRKDLEKEMKARLDSFFRNTIEPLLSTTVSNLEEKNYHQGYFTAEEMNKKMDLCLSEIHDAIKEKVLKVRGSKRKYKRYTYLQEDLMINPYWGIEEAKRPFAAKGTQLIDLKKKILKKELKKKIPLIVKLKDFFTLKDNSRKIIRKIYKNVKKSVDGFRLQIEELLTRSSHLLSEDLNEKFTLLMECVHSLFSKGKYNISMKVYYRTYKYCKNFPDIIVVWNILEKMDDLWREMKANFYWFKSYLDLKCDIFLKQADHYKEVGNYKKRLGRLKRRKRIIKMIKRLIYNNLHGEARSDYIKAYWNLNSENNALIKQVKAYILVEKAKESNDKFEKLHYLFESREIVSSIHLRYRDRDLFHRVKYMINMTQ
jgi:hypothetical protein